MTDARGWARPENRKKRVSRLIKATKTPRLSRLHIQVWHCLIGTEQPQTTPQLAEWCFPRLTKFKPSHYSAVRRAARSYASQVGATRSKGAPILWDLRPSAKKCSCVSYEDRSMEGGRGLLVVLKVPGWHAFSPPPQTTLPHAPAYYCSQMLLRKKEKHPQKNTQT